MKYPGLYNSADMASNEQQATFLSLIRAEYVILFSASVLSLDLWPSKAYFGVYAAVFLCSMGILIFRSVTKPEQVWYQARALAESVKTLTWRFAMRAQPFDDTRAADARADFRKLMEGILDSNRRDSPLKERKELYLQTRICEQRKWYEKKARSNRDPQKFGWALV
ncbi:MULTISPECIES: DUF4231 domain-containing protein [unclassified Mesorhizobium]|uniref:DUF4231 domain-containing protein n=1 Tax=unclassified Mesorhizobium TaxID=325217 RepID=UPI000F74EEC3|nr:MULTISPECIES: DUF4231 domain-containing protein [unclassified Mesorhizobium]AZN98042.1 DUF4231 domain-containing protein [Mesorhizobium sp. M9A.F.Ca.ET.002.03.1.2]AZO19538.1 DUF4231 domain-containing protein [Mesorhizobium sp. M1E.F.Ca.ET.045.02.1.1]TGQ30014.1 DUF4231 domain-containing protein [Mesorhizobium sp. M00.F.Ca.ET.216.01.1.1]TIT12093.1 MAG: DUF4231 domain-containing protein [Mesorhizobium sp.]